MPSPKRVVFFGSSAFAVPALKALREAAIDVVAVVSLPPRPAGRGRNDRPTPVAICAKACGLPLYLRQDFRSEQVQREFAEIQADIGVVVAFGAVLPKPVLDAVPHGFLNIHPSILPRWRGAAPIQRAIMAGDKLSGVCIMKMTEDLDSGPIFICKSVKIRESDTAGRLSGRLAKIAGPLLVQALTGLDDLTAKSQADTGIVYAKKISKAETRIDWSCPAEEIDCMIRGLSPAPGAWTEINGERLKILESCLLPAHGQPGELLGDDFSIACRGGAIRAVSVQRQGKKAMPGFEALRGLKLKYGQCLA